MECNLVWNHTRDFKIELALRARSIWNHKYDFRPKLHSTQFNYHFIKSILKSPKYRTWPIQIFYWCGTETLLLQYAIVQRATFNQVARALFLVTRKFYCIASAHESATTARKCNYIHFELNRPNTGLGRFKYFIDAVLSWFLNKKQNRKRFFIKIRNRAVYDLKEARKGF